MRREGPRAIATILFVTALLALFLAYDLYIADETAYAVVALLVFLILLIAGIGAVSWGRRRARLAGHRYTPPFMESEGKRVNEPYPESSLPDRGGSIPPTHKVSYNRTYHGISQEEFEQMFGSSDPWKAQPSHRIYDGPISDAERRRIEQDIRDHGMDPSQFDVDEYWSTTEERIEVATLGLDYTEEEGLEYSRAMDIYCKELDDYHAGRRSTIPKSPPLPGKGRY